MGRKKKFIDKKKSATFQLVSRDSSDPNYDDSPGGDRVFVRVDNSTYPVDTLFPEDNPDHASGAGGYTDDPNSIFADAPEDDDGGGQDYGQVYGNSASASAAQPLPEHIRREILELGFPDDGYNYLLHMREIRKSGGGSAFFENSKAKLDELPRDIKAYDASRLRISENEAPEKAIYSVASKTVNVRVKKAVDPEVSALLDDSDDSRFGSDVEDIEEDFVVQANLPEEENEDEEEEDDACIDNRPNFVEQSESKSLSNDAIEVMRNNVEGAKDDSAVEKPRVHRLLDEQFDLLLGQEYGNCDNDDDDDDYGYVSEEDESLAEKLKHATLNEHMRDDLELEGNYKAPADLLHDNETVKTKEQLDSANEIIRRCAEYGEKYENEDQDGDVVIVEESSDESEVWDCETIVTTYSNLDNHPGKIEAPGGARRKKLSETVSGALGSANHVITLRGKERLPVDFLPHGRKPTTEKVKDTGALKTEQLKRKQHGKESKEEKKERKAAVKEERREARRTKKEVKELYRGEAQHAQRVAAISGPSSIHLM